MEHRYATGPDHVARADTAALRDQYLVPDLFVPGEIRLVHTHHDRMVLGGVVPDGRTLRLEAPADLRAGTFLERREAGVVNVGGPAVVVADGERYELPTHACLYLGRGVRDVTFADAADGDGAQLYLVSAPAHTAYPTTLVLPEDGTVRELGDQETSNRRTLRQYIHADGIRSCQVVMGMTTLHPGSMWNTMPAHTHDRRTECYLYVDVPQDARVLHLMGRPEETRHLVVADRQAVISPSWSVHTGVGTAAYSFVWAMAGENQAFDDMDAVPVTAMA
ncbi:5-dehydro-4-deoxy-D-glucuronate isomerase [Cellulomonas triticagri]|uniref:4-deoxy-L-threo-5-hexosulose-uronate ketol-isomerase n=1 Tax=Cellulomonas triticagri TaxID=2483352 RepID=A0A3M2JFA5_9CELL|nr:5-dehydro-4-deoxy-D-glucuronate isomerase [Cellulomonas triticagri]RMI09665.1 5-dehydro-4-deoxy-D-glucuronate isomerase [Cellulomonas triticagri]